MMPQPAGAAEQAGPAGPAGAALGAPTARREFTRNCTFRPCAGRHPDSL